MPVLTIYSPAMIASAVTLLFIAINWKKKNKRGGYYFGLAIVFFAIFCLTVAPPKGSLSLIHDSLAELEKSGREVAGMVVVKKVKALRGGPMFCFQAENGKLYGMTNRLKTGLVTDPENSPINGSAATAYTTEQNELISVYTRDGVLLHENMKSYGKLYGGYVFYMLFGFLISTASLVRAWLSTIIGQEQLK